MVLLNKHNIITKQELKSFPYYLVLEYKDTNNILNKKDHPIKNNIFLLNPNQYIPISFRVHIYFKI